jgi:hypothetical protein
MVVHDDNVALTRGRLEAGEAEEDTTSTPQLLTGETLEAMDALDLVEQCAARAPRAELATIAERIGRAYSRAMTRLAAREREAVRASVDRS